MRLLFKTCLAANGTLAVLLMLIGLLSPDSFWVCLAISAGGSVVAMALLYGLLTLSTLPAISNLVHRLCVRLLVPAICFLPLLALAIYAGLEPAADAFFYGAAAVVSYGGAALQFRALDKLHKPLCYDNFN